MYLKNIHCLRTTNNALRLILNDSDSEKLYQSIFDIQLKYIKVLMINIPLK